MKPTSKMFFQLMCGAVSLMSSIDLHFLQIKLSLLLKNLNLNTRQGLWFQQDGAPPQFHKIVRHYCKTKNKIEVILSI